MPHPGLEIWRMPEITEGRWQLAQEAEKKYCELKKRPLNYIQKHAEEFNTGKNSFDLATCFNVLDHSRDSKTIVKNVFETLVPGGYFLLWSPRYHYLANIVEKY
jgi:2-polyprenyl-3-methyl-5-hydroxy-6-metoxy-1,4-benzoquinol methylase